ncbi:hypothetical protein B0J13DRAFT_608004 [Dactylonectria estremocensis]|uniref:D-arabinono-1,4-lactone oxidase n=1 Tax=Dactylonectria estremocensis TaxID=1079267 RepID=A0A9P9EQD4_9HYPO|nr:hypothetical protein B0J13DRAFT_608004 [Dactylonectria estremocensis]
MDYLDLSAADLVRKFDNDPNDDALVEAMQRRIMDPDQNIELFEEIKALKEEYDEKAPTFLQSTEESSVPEWQNCIGWQKCFPKEKRYPQGISDLSDAVRDGKARKLQVRAVGSGHSFSDVCPTNGILLDPHGMNKFLEIDPAILKNPSDAESHVFVESGITIKSLNDQLDKMGKALATMGAYDGQTLAGAISTGTHGSGIALGNLASLVRGIVLVSESGTIYQIEPKDGITDPTKFKSGVAQVLKQDDDWFHAALVAMGCLGLIHSYTLEVVPSFLLNEKRTLTTWQDYKPELASGISSQPLSNHYFEIDLNPYPTLGKNFAVTIVRNVPPTGTQASGSRGFADWLAGVVAEIPCAEEVLVWFLNRWPWLSPGTISGAMRTLEDDNYVDKSFKVLNIGRVDDVKAYAMELSFDATQDIVAIVDRILALFQQAAEDHQWFLAGPFALRFVKASDAFLAPQEGRTTMMVEMDMLYGIKTGQKLLTFMTQQLCSGPDGKGVRVHWGLDLDTVQKGDLAIKYAQSDKWLAVYKQLNSTGIWNSPFTDRLGITMPM